MLCDPPPAERAFGVLARRIRTLADEIADLDDDLEASITTAAQVVLAMYGVGLDVAGEFLATADDNPERFRRPLAHRPGQTALRPCLPRPTGTAGAWNRSRTGDLSGQRGRGFPFDRRTRPRLLCDPGNRQLLLGKFLLIFSLT